MENEIAIEKAVMPFKIQQLAEIIMEKKQIGFTDALHYLYSSDFYPQLISKDTKWWYVSGYELFEIIENSKKRQQDLLKNRKLTLFYVFCLDNYKNKVKQSEETVLSVFTEKNVFLFLQDNFETLHSQSADYIVSAIEDYLKNTTTP